MKKGTILSLSTATALCLSLVTSCATKMADYATEKLTTVGNPYLPLWEHIPDGEPYVFDDPDNPGKQRVYIYGSHDDLITEYCGRDQVVWSAPVEDLTQWRYDGVILVVDKNRDGEKFDSAGTADVLYAPDVTLVTDSTGKKTYYLFPNDQTGFRNGLIAKSDRPDGPFKVCNWNKENPNLVDGVLQFDPAVFVDDDGRVYGYWGFERSYAAEFDPTTMATVKPGTMIVEDMISGRNQEGRFKFFEASSIRKIKDKYVFIYSRFTEEGEFGLPTSNYTLAYAYSDHPLGPWTYGGTIIDGRGREKDEQGNVIASATPDGNTHGSICEINGKWWVFYHRQTGTDEYARQAMVAPIEVKVEEGVGGKVEISEGEYNSEGFATNGLNPLERHSAGIACWYTGPKPATHEWPNNTFYGSYVASGYGTESNFDAPYDLKNNTNDVVNNTDGSIVGYKYFNFSDVDYGTHLFGQDGKLLLNLTPQGIDGTIEIMVDRPWASQGMLLGKIELKADMKQEPTEMSVVLPDLSKLEYKRAIFFVFKSNIKDRSLCTLHDFVFTKD
ncbi:family 43 glycosylhydrolase [Prevotella sp. E15-22]|uniref:family 43 glycosylhydrolase n=1 Tax=Prevotella sp. E15-22 TaxID=2937774 RepID=UPI00204C3C57|nr:family 43 glycosylhydrolase [Prevotella sp. E15-22]UPS45510.1 family 43 glycosylhydrolase [Prevotella sp. E15-22]